MTKLKNSNCDKAWKLKLWQNSNTFVTTLKLKLWPNSKTQVGTKLKNLNCNRTQKLKLLPNSKTQIVTIPKLSQFFVNCFLLQKFCDIFQHKKNHTLTAKGCVQGSFFRYSQCFSFFPGTPGRGKQSYCLSKHLCIYLLQQAERHKSWSWCSQPKRLTPHTIDIIVLHI